MLSPKAIIKPLLSPLIKTASKYKIRVLMYHRFDKNDNPAAMNIKYFDIQCKFIKKHYNIISLSDYVEFITQSRRPPENSVIFTIDDGYYDFYEYAFPVLKKYEIPATVFVTTGFIDNALWLWPDVIRHIIYNTPLEEYTFNFENYNKSFSISKKSEKENIWNFFASLCIKIMDEKKIKLIDQIKNELSVSIADEPIKEFSSFTWENMYEMETFGIEFGSHTCTHPILSKINSQQKHFEIVESKIRIEEKLQREIVSFCYPNGQKGDYDKETIKFIKASGYKCATVACRGFNDINTNPYLLKRIAINDKNMCSVLNGFEYYGDKIRNLFN